ncbi:MAG: type II secretion system protein GspJ [Alphaproteobacteria bacterium]
MRSPDRVARAGRRGESGLTLLEVMVALSIAAIIAIAQAAPFRRAIAARDRAEEALEQTTSARIALDRIAEELTGATAVKGRRFAVADRTLDRPSSELTFATGAAHRLGAGPRDPVEVVRYRLVPDASGRRTGRLVKEQVASVAPESAPPAQAVVLEGVTSFQVRVLPSQSPDWSPTWTGGDTGKSEDLPRAVEVEIGVDEGDVEPTPYQVAVSLPMGPRR